MSDTGGVTLTPEEIEGLRAERDAAIAERDAERQARESEARRADGLYARVATGDRQIAAAQVSGLAAQETQAESVITAINGEIAHLKSQKASLYAEGKFEEAEDIGEKIADAAARRNQAQQAKSYYAQQRDTASKQPIDPVDRFLVANPNYTEAEQIWIKSNPRYATDQDFQGRVNAAHTVLISKGIVRQSPEYFQGLEQAGYMRAPPQAQPQPKPAASGGAAAHQGEGGETGEGESPYSEGATAIVEEPTVPQPARPQTRGQVAAAPSHRSPTPARDPPGQTRLTPDEAAAALAMSDLFPEEVQADGEAGIYAHYAKIKNSPTAKRIKADWAAGG